jgi:hypothetical protein
VSTSPLERLVGTLTAGFLALLVVRWFRLRDRDVIGPVGPEGDLVIEYKRATCKGANYEYHTACTDGWWEHWWDGIQYCDDAKATCELHGGVFTIR